MKGVFNCSKRILKNVFDRKFELGVSIENLNHGKINKLLIKS